jgi:hypothetical protein
MDSFDRTRASPDGMGHDDVLVGDVRGRRAHPRENLLLAANIWLGDEAEMRDVRIRNLSEGGLMFELDKIVEVGTPVRFALRGIGDVAGKVAWCAAGRMGVALDAPIDPEKARKLVSKVTLSPQPFQTKKAPRS